MPDSDLVDVKNPKYPVGLWAARHGQITYRVPTDSVIRLAQALDELNLPSFLPRYFRLQDRKGLTDLIFFFVDHRSSQLGAYFHTGILTRAIPRQLADGPSAYYFSLEVVNRRFTRLAGSKIWGYPKVLGKIEKRERDQDGVEVKLLLSPERAPESEWTGEDSEYAGDERDQAVYTITLPKLQEREALRDYRRDVYTYTLLNDKPTVTRFERASVGERVREWDQESSVRFHEESRYGQLLKRFLQIDQHAGREVRWAMRMSGLWHPPQEVA